jgi:hypothetical protein
MLVFGIALVLAGCGSNDMTGTGAGDSCSAHAGFCATLTVPTGFTATPVKLIVGLYKQLGAGGPAGPPDAIAMQTMNPVISPATPLALDVSDVTVSGAYYVYAALYNPGGGMFQPVKGVDYTAQTTSPITLGGSTSPALGTLALEPAQ